MSSQGWYVCTVWVGVLWIRAAPWRSRFIRIFFAPYLQTFSKWWSPPHDSPLQPNMKSQSVKTKNPIIIKTSTVWYFGQHRFLYLSVLHFEFEYREHFTWSLINRVKIRIQFFQKCVKQMYRNAHIYIDVDQRFIFVLIVTTIIILILVVQKLCWCDTFWYMGDVPPSLSQNPQLYPGPRYRFPPNILYQVVLTLARPKLHLLHRACDTSGLRHQYRHHHHHHQNLRHQDYNRKPIVIVMPMKWASLKKWFGSCWQRSELNPVLKYAWEV